MLLLEAFMSKIDGLLEEMIESQVDSLVQEDSYYKMFETPLKPAASFKKAHRKQLVDFFKLIFITALFIWVVLNSLATERLFNFIGRRTFWHA